MPLKRISDQKSITIIEFYTELVNSDNEVSQKNGKAMLELIDGLDRFFVNETIWCLTSLYRLVLLSADDWRSPWNVVISCGGPSDFRVEYLIPGSDTMKHFNASTINRAMLDVFTAMKISGGWGDIEG